MIQERCSTYTLVFTAVYNMTGIDVKICHIIFVVHAILIIIKFPYNFINYCHFIMSEKILFELCRSGPYMKVINWM